MSDHVFLVCGFTRCGTSLVMQMLEAGGFSVSGDWPAFEDDIVTSNAPVAEWAKHAGGAVKALDPQHFTPPAGIPYRALLLTRNPRQQALSQAKYANFFLDLKINRGGRKLLEKSYAADLPPTLAILNRLCGPKGWSVLRFEDLIAEPESAAVQIAQMATGEVRPSLDIAAMARAVRPRSSDCLHGMLEVALMQERVA